MKIVKNSFIVRIHCIMTVTVVSPKELDDLAHKVDKILPSDLRFFRYGNRLVQIKRYLLEHELDISKTVSAIKRTAVWRKEWNADSIVASDVMEMRNKLGFMTFTANEDGLRAISIRFDIPSSTPFPPLEQVTEVFIFMMDHILKDLEDLSERHVDIPLKDYGKIVVNAECVNMHFVRHAFPNYPKAIMELLFSHYPCFLSLSDIFVSDDPSFVPVVHESMYTLYLQNAPYFVKGLFTILKGMLPERWSRQICINTYLYLPPCMNTDCVPTQNGGKSSLTSQKWLQEIAAEENCLLDHPTKHVLTTRILDQMGKGGSFKACEMPNSYARARMWKMTNVGGRWHHYYFVLTKENILYYFADADDTEIRTG